MKKLASVILSLIMVFLMSAGASALTTNSVIPTATLNKILKEYRNALKAGDKYVSLSSYGLSGSATENELYEFFYRADAELGSITYGKYCDEYAIPYVESSSGAIKGVKINYWDRYTNEDGTCDMEHVKRDQRTVNERFIEAKSIVKNTMNDVEKALVLYDYIIGLVDYADPIETDSRGYETFAIDAHTITGLFCDRLAVCDAYSKLYAMLLNDVGIKAITVDSDEMAHEWVMAQIDGEWYHFDPTWDDYKYHKGYTALWDKNDDNWDRGAAHHKYFLISDEEIKEGDHPDWELSYEVNPDHLTSVPSSGKSGKYDDKFFSPKNEKYSCCTLMNYINGSWYFIDLKSLSIVNATYDGSEEYIELPDEEIPKYSFGYGNDLYVCTNYSILRYDTMSGKFEKIFEIPEEDRETDDFSEMSIIYDEMTVVKASYTFDENDEFKDVSFSTETYPMNEVERMRAIVGDPDEDDDSASMTRDSEKVPDVSVVRPGSGSDKSTLSSEEKALIESAESSGKRMMAFVYLGIAALFIIIAAVAIIIVIKYVKKK
jgi:hypothetical protein